MTPAGWLCPKCNGAHGPHVDTCPTQDWRYTLAASIPMPVAVPQGTAPVEKVFPMEQTTAITTAPNRILSAMDRLEGEALAADGGGGGEALAADGGREPGA